MVEDIKAGEFITEKNVRSIRPGFGMHPKYYKEIIGKKFILTGSKGDPLTSESIE